MRTSLIFLSLGYFSIYEYYIDLPYWCIHRCHPYHSLSFNWKIIIIDERLRQFRYPNFVRTGWNWQGQRHQRADFKYICGNSLNKHQRRRLEGVRGQSVSYLNRAALAFPWKFKKIQHRKFIQSSYLFSSWHVYFYFIYCIISMVLKAKAVSAVFLILQESDLKTFNIQLRFAQNLKRRPSILKTVIKSANLLLWDHEFGKLYTAPPSL